MDRKQLFEQIQKKASYLCIGLDTDLNKIPSHLKKEKDPIATFNKAIIEETHDLCVSYKPNIAFYEAYGAKGWESLSKTLKYIPEDIFTIADAKRGDIGNTSKKYAQAFFENQNFDSVTVAPYMGEDSVKPFLEFKEKWVILLGLTSNFGSEDFQLLKLKNDAYLFEEVLRKAQKWGSPDQLMYVLGATKDDTFSRVRELIPHHFLLVPGVGVQGGNLQKLSKYGMNKQCGMLVNSSRGIIYASNGKDFAKAARKQALKLQEEMKKYLNYYLL